jgi:Rod binding domain-containing protein
VSLPIATTLSGPVALTSSVPSHHQPPTDSPAVQRLRRAAGEFEGVLLANLWKSMKSTFAASDDDATDPAHGTLEDMSIQAMSGAVGKAGGLGIGKLILKHLEPTLAHSQNGNQSAPSKASTLPADTLFDRQ